MESKNIIEVIRTLIGPIDPVGEAHTDAQRFENMKVMTEVIEALVEDLQQVTRHKDQHASSMSKAAWFADNFIDNLGYI